MKYFKDKGLIFVVMEKGERIKDNFEKLILKEKVLESGIILSSTGMVKDVEIGYGYYDGKIVSYEKEILEGPFELLSMSGLLINNENYPFHIHINLGDKEKRSFGGHLFDGVVHTFVEMVILESNIKLDRELKDGLNILNFTH
ncbi:MAG: PPC domain-containing DNA-binding protein [candidate division WOR-3 bacterium]